MGDALMILGEAGYREGKPGLALRNYFTAMREYEWTGDSVRIARAALAIGNVFSGSGLDEKAVEYYLKAMKGGGALFEELDLLRIRESIAGSYTRLGRDEEAVELYRELYERYSVLKDPALQVSALNRLTASLNRLGRPAEAIEYNLKALEISQESGNRNGEMAALNNLGYSKKFTDENSEALEFFKRALETGEAIHAPLREMTTVLTNLAIIEGNMGRERESMEYYLKADKMASSAGDTAEMARIRYLTAMAYFLAGDYYQAGIFNRDALRLAEAVGNSALKADSYLLSSRIAAELYDYEVSMGEYMKFLSIRDSLLVEERSTEQALSQQQYLVERTEKELDEELYTRQLERVENSRLRLEIEKGDQEKELLRKTADLQASELKNRELEKNRALQELLLAEEKLAAERKDREIQDLKVTQQLQESELRRSELEQVRQQQEITVLTQEKKISELNLERVRVRTRFLAGIVILALISLVLIIRSWRFTRKTNRTLAGQRNKIQQQKEALESQYEVIKIEREKSEKLLLNILPEETAAELKEKGYASPRHYDRVTVLFTDFVGFTQVTEKMTPETVIRELDYCFLEFDKIIDRHNLEKIKTIGDSYMCAGGIPLSNDTNPFDVVRAALEIRDFMDNTRRAREARGEDYWQLRIGVNTGPVVAGVVGKNKFAYDIWGDAVNLASRMESSGEAGKVNISGETYQIIKEQFRCTHRGKVKAKNKGEVDMYFVEGPAAN
jgi:class 3 adenylate cyclase